MTDIAEIPAAPAAPQRLRLGASRGQGERETRQVDKRGCAIPGAVFSRDKSDLFAVTPEQRQELAFTSDLTFYCGSDTGGDEGNNQTTPEL